MYIYTYVYIYIYIYIKRERERERDRERARKINIHVYKYIHIYVDAGVCVEVMPDVALRLSEVARTCKGVHSLDFRLEIRLINLFGMTAPTVHSDTE